MLKTLINQTLSNNLKSYKFLKNLRVGLAVSGGVDSMVLLDLFNKIKVINNLELYVLHYNHKWRASSNNDAKLVKQYCIKNKIRFIYKEATGNVIKSEENARDRRYSFFREVAKKYKLDYVCTAHHKDDQVETVLFRLARGTGSGGLTPIKDFLELSNESRVFRPLLNVTRSEIQNYALNNNLSFIQDKTNFDIQYKRNLIRIKILPLLSRVNKNVVNNILLCSDLVYSQNKVLEKFFERLLKTFIDKNVYNLWIQKKEPFSYIAMNRKRFLKLDYFTQKSFIYWFLNINKIKGSISRLELVLTSIKDRHSISLSKEYFFYVDENKIILELVKSRVKNIDSLPVKETFILDNKNIRIMFQKDKMLLINLYKNKVFKKPFPSDKEMKAYVDLSKYFRKKFTLRTRKPFDVFQPLGLKKSLKLKKYLINKKIIRGNRYNLPLLCYRKEVLWIPGYAVSDKIRVENIATHVLEIKENNGINLKIYP